MDIQANKDLFINRLQAEIGHREGFQELLAFITNPKRDFFTAPATANDVLAVPGGAIKYALMLHDVLQESFEKGPYAHVVNLPGYSGSVTREIIAVVTLLSALDNGMLFTTEVKNRKTYDPQKIAEAPIRGEAVRSDSNGQFIWESYQAYEYDDSIPLGSGVRAISFIQAFMHLKKEELLCLRWGKTHNAGMDSGSLYSALKKSLLLSALQNAHQTVKFLLANEAHFDYFSKIYGSSLSKSTTSNYSPEYSNPQREIYDEKPSEKNFTTEPSQTLGSNSFVEASSDEKKSPQSVQSDFLKELEDMDKVMFGG